MTANNPPNYRSNKTIAERQAAVVAQRQAFREGKLKGVTTEELEALDIFESDEELYAFLKFVREQRNAHLC